MINVQFMQKPYSVDELISQYQEEIKKLRVDIKSPIDETKLQTYYQAVNTFKNVSIMDMVQFALSYGRSAGGKSAQMRSAFPTLLGNRVTQATAMDVAYAKLLLTYALAFKASRGNLKEWMLRFVLSSRFSPLSGWIDSQIDHVIENTRRNIVAYSAKN